MGAAWFGSMWEVSTATVPGRMVGAAASAKTVVVPRCTTLLASVLEPACTTATRMEGISEDRIA